MRRVDFNTPDRRFTGFRFLHLITGVLQSDTKYSSEIDIIIDDEHTPFIIRHWLASIVF